MPNSALRPRRALLLAQLFVSPACTAAFKTFDEPRHLCRADGDRLANCRCPWHADQHRFGNRQIRIDSTGAITAAFGVASHRQGWKRRSLRSSPTISREIWGYSGGQGDSDAVPMSTEPTPAERGAGRRCCENTPRKSCGRKSRSPSHLLEAAADDIDVTDGLATVTGTDRAVTFNKSQRRSIRT